MDKVEAIAAILLKIAQAAPTVIQTVKDLYPVAQKMVSYIEGGAVSDDDLAALNVEVDQAFAESQEEI